ncbi:MarR family winged helix-turn-helix transcriptional regulator [Psychromonas ossibalaenae]|uniref:MarR family winged helix-turn-helix transcriptional regulator n=1 Tax=Psychromonas ossibalaenae TaxID=444922 RepID=UPI000368E523|nr:MarR family transcriptional regulator [Psychromonas ossibalaenae]
MKEIEQLNHSIIEFYDKLSSWEHAVVREQNISLAQVHTIEVLGSHGAMRMKELADRLGITTGTLTVQIDKLVNAGFIARRPHESDRRSILVDLTDSGRHLYREHDDLHLALTQDITANLDKDQRKILQLCLSKMNNEF